MTERELARQLDVLEAEIERLLLALAAMTDPTIDDIEELQNMAREVLGWPAVKRARDRCNARGYHVASADGVAKFRYDQAGVCLDCGVVGEGNR
jgi:hypothetical protein